MADAKQIFAEIDTDNDGYISVAELKDYLQCTRSTSDAASSRYFGCSIKAKTSRSASRNSSSRSYRVEANKVFQQEQHCGQVELGR
jgi:hypothetical protein